MGVSRISHLKAGGGYFCRVLVVGRARIEMAALIAYLEQVV